MKWQFFLSKILKNGPGVFLESKYIPSIKIVKETNEPILKGQTFKNLG